MLSKEEIKQRIAEHTEALIEIAKPNLRAGLDGIFTRQTVAHAFTIGYVTGSMKDDGAITCCLLTGPSMDILRRLVASIPESPGERPEEFRIQEGDDKPEAEPAC